MLPNGFGLLPHSDVLKMDDCSLFFFTIAMKGFENGLEAAGTDFFFEFFDSSSDSLEFESELEFSEEDDSAFSFFCFFVNFELPGMSNNDL